MKTKFWKCMGGGRTSNVYEILTFYHWFLCLCFLLSCSFVIWLNRSRNSHLQPRPGAHVHVLVALPTLVFLFLLLGLERTVQPVSPNLNPGLWVKSNSFLCSPGNFCQKPGSPGWSGKFRFYFYIFLNAWVTGSLFLDFWYLCFWKPPRLPFLKIWFLMLRLHA